MNKKETSIIAKLIKIADNQQKIISDLVQKVAQDSDPMAAYLGRAANVAGVNGGIHGAATVTSDGNEKYTVQMTGVPADNASKQKISDEFYRMIETQKPNLVGKVNLLF